MKRKMNINKIILAMIITGALLTPSCEPGKKMRVETGVASDISTTTANVSGKVIDVGEGATQHGHCYGTSAGPAVSGTKTALGVAAAGDFTSSLTGLQPSTTYYVRAYASLGAEAAYGSEITFTTASAALPELTTTAITSITKTSAVSGGNITSEGGTPVTARGVCWNVASGPTVALSTKTTDGTGSGSFASSITGLSANTIYYVRAYATNAGGTAYGNEISFTTSPEVAVAPTVTTAEVTSVTPNSAISGGDVTNEGGAPVTARGVCWHTSANPTIINSKTTDGTGSGSFVSNLTNLNPGTTYYVRAYATNSAGTSYGNEHSFTTTVVVPTLSTIAITSITSTTAVSGGNITSDGGSAVTVRGVCWKTSQAPTIDDPHTSDGLGSGTYASNLTGLTGNTTYYVRAYATNSAGTGYGDEKSFKTGTTVPGAPTSISATKGDAQATVTFTAPASDGGSSITGYTATSNPGSFTGTGTASPVTVTGLTNGTAYTFTVTATNANGTGQASAASNSVTPSTALTVPGAPTGVSAVSGYEKATVTFTAPVNDGGSAITGYTVTSSPGGFVGTGSASPISVTGLPALIAYTFTVTATNAIGTGPASAASNSVTPTTVPGAPTIGTATKGNAQASVTFTAPASDGGSAITGYTVTSNPGSFTGTSTTVSPITVTGLTNGTAYTFTVTATNANGTGSASAASNSVTPSTVPGAPTSVTATKGNE